MTFKQLCLWIMFISFGLFSSWVMWEVGYMGIWQAGFESPGSLQILLDLVVCCLLICSWIKNDADARGVNPYPWIAFVFSSGSLAILVYLIVREYQKSSEPNLQVN